MMIIKKAILLSAIICLIASCSHNQLPTRKVTGKDLTCADINNELQEMLDLEENLHSKTDMSGRDVGMILIFCPNMSVNKISWSKAKELVAKREELLLELHKEKGCGKKSTTKK